MKTVAGLAELGIRPASALSADRDGHAANRLPVTATLRDILPGGLPRGSTTTITSAGSGASSLLLALLAAPTKAGAWCAIVGMPTLSLAAAMTIGVDLEHIALIPDPGPDLATVVATLLDGFDLVAVAPASPLTAALCSQLSARARATDAALVSMTTWTGASMTLTAEGGTWYGRRRLRCRQLSVTVTGRGGAGRPRRTQVWLPEDLQFQATLPAADQPRRRLQVVR
ncbi:hypothetical protein [Catellatospora sichuanensis]|uniref:hypothetical protein n=1 Tax=Catellatospora sichuanensis TaxID=1969805 RepID=UPI00118281B2|nr:hypothetical protein [Catellatospora sichuanensis]